MSSNTIMSNVEQTSDIADLIDQAVAGSRAAFSELLTQNHVAVRRFLARFVHSAADADDLAQEVFLAAFRDIGRYDFSAPFRAWLMGIARHRALHHLRSELRRKKRENNVVQIAMAEMRLHRAESSDTEANERETEALRDCLDNLPKHSRQLVNEFYFSGRRATEIAIRLDMNDTAVRMALLRIRRGLLDCVQGKLDRLERRV